MKRWIGGMGMLFGILTMALEIYGLKVLQALERTSGTWRINAWGYATEAPCAVALTVTVLVIVVSAVLFFGGEEK